MTKHDKYAWGLFLFLAILGYATFGKAKFLLIFVGGGVIAMILKAVENKLDAKESMQRQRRIARAVELLRKQDNSSHG